MRFQDSFLRLVFVFTAVFTAEIPQVGATEALPVEIMPIGDSITRGSWTPYSVRNDVPGGYRKTLFQQLVATGATVDFVGDKSDNAAAAIDPHHNGNDGWRTDQMLAALPTWLAADPDVVLLKAGTNDILQQKTVPDILRNLENLILETLLDRPGRRVFVATVIPVISNWGGIPQAVHAANVESYNAGVREITGRLAAQGHDVELVELNQSLVLTDPDPAKNFFQPGDGVHPGQAGYDQLGELWFSALTSGPPLPHSPPAGVPVARSGLGAAVASPTSAVLTWTDPAGDETTQEIWCRETTSGVWKRMATVPADVTSFHAIGLRTTDRSYRFTIVAVNGSGASAWSNRVTINATGGAGNLALGRPAAALNNYGPAYSAEKANDGSITSMWASTGMALHWWQVDLQDGYQIGKVEMVTRQDASNVPDQRRNFEILASNDPAFGTFTVLGGQGGTALDSKATFSLTPTDGTAYRYLRVRKTVAESFTIAELRIFGTMAMEIPSPPVDTDAAWTAQDSVRIQWTTSSENHSGFRVERRRGSGAFLTVATIDGSGTEVIDTTLEAGAHYIYRVFAVNEAGESPPGEEVSITTPPEPTTYDSWSEAFPEFLALDAEDRSPGADANKDGVSNLLAYASGEDPLAPFDPARRPGIHAVGDPVDGEFQFRFIRNLAATDLEYRVERSGALSPPEWSGVSLDAAESSVLIDDAALEEVILPIFRNETTVREWFRLVVTRSDVVPGD